MIENLFPYRPGTSESAHSDAIAARIAMGGLVAGAARGDYTLPESFTKPWAALQHLAVLPVPTVAPSAQMTAQESVAALRAAAMDAGKPPAIASLHTSRTSAQDKADWEGYRQQVADGLYLECFRSLGPSVIVEHIAPALDKLIRSFAADCTVLGHYSEATDPNLAALLVESDKLRQAYVRWLAFPTAYMTVRQGWAVLRRWDASPLLDPAGEHGLLCEIRNAPELLPDTWQKVIRGNARGPWATDHPAIRAAWLIRHGARFWAPTTLEWNAAYPFRPDPRPAYLRNLAEGGDSRAVAAWNLAVRAAA